MLQIELTPKALANFSPGFEHGENPGIKNFKRFNPERVPRPANPFRVSDSFVTAPKVVAALQPWAEISQRLRR